MWREEPLGGCTDTVHKHPDPTGLKSVYTEFELCQRNLIDIFEAKHFSDYTLGIWDKNILNVSHTK